MLLALPNCFTKIVVQATIISRQLANRPITAVLSLFLTSDVNWRPSAADPRRAETTGPLGKQSKRNGPNHASQLFETGALAIPLSRNCMSHQVCFNSFFYVAVQHPILETMPNAVEGVFRRLHEAVLPQEFVHGGREARACKVSGKAFGALLERLQADTCQRDDPTRWPGFERAPLWLDRDVWEIHVEADMASLQALTLAWPVSSVYHPEQDTPSFRVEPGKGAGSKYFIPDPRFTEWHAGALFAFAEIQPGESLRHRQTLCPANEAKGRTDMREVFVGAVRGEGL